MNRSTKVSAIAAAGLLLAIGSQAQSAGAPDQYTPAQLEVLAPVKAFFEAMTRHDVEATRKLMVAGAGFVVIKTDGSVLMQHDADYLDSLSKHKESMLERIWDAQVTVRDNIAQVWAPYDFHFDGKFSHCGIDVFNMVRTRDGWRIAGISYSAQKTGCKPSPLDRK